MEDVKIIELYFERDKKAIDETAAKYGGLCMSISMNILGVREDAQECVNDTYLKTWESIPPHRPSLLSAFVGKIARNLSINRLSRNTAAKRGGSQGALILDELSGIVSGSGSVEEEAEAKEMIRDINAFIGTLSEEQRYIFLRRYWYCDSIGDIAKSCKKSSNAVTVSLARTRGKLKEYLTERGYDL